MNNMLKNLFKKKNEWLEFDELATAFTPMTVEQQKSKKGGGEATFLGYEHAGNLGLANSFNPTTARNQGILAPLSSGQSFGSSASVSQSDDPEPGLSRTKRWSGGGGYFSGGQYGPGLTITGSPSNNSGSNNSGGNYNGGSYSGYPSGSNPSGNQQGNAYYEAKRESDRIAREKLLERTKVTPTAPKSPTDQGDNWVHKDGATTIYLNEVVIRPDKPSGDFATNFKPLPDGSQLGNSLTGTPGRLRTPVANVISKSSERVTVSPVKKPQVAKQPSEDPDFYDAILNLISCADLTLAGAEAAAATMKVSLPKVMGITGRITPIFGIVDNFLQMTEEGFNWNDASQMAAGSALVGAAFVGGTAAAPVIFAGGAVIFVWELGETYIIND